MLIPVCDKPNPKDEGSGKYTDDGWRWWGEGLPTLLREVHLYSTVPSVPGAFHYEMRKKKQNLKKEKKRRKN